MGLTATEVMLRESRGPLMKWTGYNEFGISKSTAALYNLLNKESGDMGNILDVIKMLDGVIEKLEKFVASPAFGVAVGLGFTFGGKSTPISELLALVGMALTDRDKLVALYDSYPPKHAKDYNQYAIDIEEVVENICKTLCNKYTNGNLSYCIVD